MIRINKNNTLVYDHIEKVYPQLKLRINNIIKDGGLKSKVTKNNKTTKVLTIKISKNDEWNDPKKLDKNQFSNSITKMSKIIT